MGDLGGLKAILFCSPSRMQVQSHYQRLWPPGVMLFAATRELAFSIMVI